MTTRRIKIGILTTGSVGLVGFFSMLAMAADEANMARETFIQTAERFGIFAAISVSFTVVSLACLVWLVHYVITTFQEVVDANTASHIRLREILKTKPCLTESDVDRIAGDGSSGDDAALRAIERRRARKAKSDA